jgi:hypothetical protein
MTLFYNEVRRRAKVKANDPAVRHYLATMNWTFIILLRWGCVCYGQMSCDGEWREALLKQASGSVEYVFGQRSCNRSDDCIC